MLRVVWLLVGGLVWPAASPTPFPTSRQDAVSPGNGAITLPPGPVAELLARVADTPAQALHSPWPKWEDRSSNGWGGEPAWRRWVELVRAESPPLASEPARRAELAELALLQGRDADAWAHLLACADELGLVASLLPLFSPGVPPENAGADVLPDGVLLRPALPPSAVPRAGLRWLACTRIEHHGFVVGEARCSLSVSVDRDGLEVALRHLGGGPARVRVLPPLPRGIDAGLVFADWEKRPGNQGPVEFELDSEANEHTLWLTFHPRRERWPDPQLETLRRLTPGREIRVVSARADEPHLARFAEALGELFGARSALRPDSAPTPVGLEPLVMHFDSGAVAERKLCDLIGLAESFALSTPLR